MLIAEVKMVGGIPSNDLMDALVNLLKGCRVMPSSGPKEK
jgi:hypothetical protein